MTVSNPAASAASAREGRAGRLAALLLLLVPAGPATAASDACWPGAADGRRCPCAIADLHPTQIAVGEDQVKSEVTWLRGLGPAALAKLEDKEPEPVVRGPGHQLYITDHHHLARAMAELGITETVCVLTADLSALSPADFAARMVADGMARPVDETGVERPFDALPATVLGLTDDPYRSLAWRVREAGGFGKSDVNFAEFQWADYFRPLVTPQALAQDPAAALGTALKAARAPAACRLPGYEGPAC